MYSRFGTATLTATDPTVRIATREGAVVITGRQALSGDGDGIYIIDQTGAIRAIKNTSYLSLSYASGILTITNVSTSGIQVTWFVPKRV